MTHPFASTAGAGGENGSEQEYVTLATAGVNNVPVIVFINWREENLPTSKTPSGKDAEVVGVDVVNLQTGHVFQNIWVRQVYPIIAFKKAGIGSMAIGVVQYTPAQLVGNGFTPPKYEWVDLSGDQQWVQTGMNWLNGPGTQFVRSTKPANVVSQPSVRNVQQGQPQQWGQPQQNQGYQPQQNQPAPGQVAPTWGAPAAQPNSQGWPGQAAPGWGGQPAAQAAPAGPYGAQDNPQWLAQPAQPAATVGPTPQAANPYPPVTQVGAGVASGWVQPPTTTYVPDQDATATPAPQNLDEQRGSDQGEPPSVDW